MAHWVVCARILHKHYLIKIPNGNSMLQMRKPKAMVSPLLRIKFPDGIRVANQLLYNREIS